MVNVLLKKKNKKGYLYYEFPKEKYEKNKEAFNSDGWVICSDEETLQYYKDRYPDMQVEPPKNKAKKETKKQASKEMFADEEE